MNRFVYNQLIAWKKHPGTNVLIIGGIPGVGKFDLVERFVQNCFNSYKVLSDDSFIDSDGIIGSDVVVFRDIKGDRDRLKSIIELSGRMPETSFIVIDSFVKEGRGESFPISANYIILYPLSFEEFLFNTRTDLFNTLASLESVDSISETIHIELNALYRDFIITGGMPEVVKFYNENGLDFNGIREIQKRIIENIYSELSSHYKTTEYKNLIKIIKLIVPSLSRDNRKFKLSDISLSTRYNTFNKYFQILENLNLIYISRLKKSSDLSVDSKSFIIYFSDTGLLGAIEDIPMQIYSDKVMLSNQLLTALTVNSTATELFSGFKRQPIFYWHHNMSKIEFLIEVNENLYPIELKDDSSGKLKSLDSFKNIYDAENLIRINLDPPDSRGSIKTYPLYLVKNLFRKISSN